MRRTTGEKMFSIFIHRNLWSNEQLSINLHNPDGIDELRDKFHALVRLRLALAEHTSHLNAYRRIIKNIEIPDNVLRSGPI